MKTTRILALFLALVLCISSIPFAFAEDNYEIPTVTTTKAIICGDNYFAIGLNIYDKNGNSIGGIPFGSDGGNKSNETDVIYVGDNYVLVAEYTSNLDTVTYIVYSIGDRNVISKEKEFSMSFGSGITVPTPSEDGEYLAINMMSIGEEISLSGYVLFDSYGHELLRESDKACIPLGKGCIATVSTTEANKTEILNNIGKDVIKNIIDAIAYEATSYGDIIVTDEDGNFGIVNNYGETIISSSNEYIEELDGYYVAKNNLNADSWLYGSSTVYDRFGNKKRYVSGDIIAVGDEVCVTQSSSYTYSLVNLKSGTVIAKGDDYYSECGYFAVGDFEKGATLYDNIGNVVLSDLLDAYSFSVSALTGEIIYTSKNGDIMLLADGKPEKFATKCDYAYFIESGLIVCGNYDKDIEWVEQNGMKITSNHYSFDSSYKMDGCDIIAMSAKSGDLKTVYIVKDKASSVFPDVADGYWAAADILAAYRNGLMNGTGGGLFSPTGTVTRAQVVTILWRLAGCPDPKQSDDYTTWDPYFSDVKESAWYYQASEWAGSYGIVSGTSMNPDAPTFSGDRPITRAEVVALFARFVEYEGWYVELGADIAGFADIDSVPSWATEFFGWGVETGLITGKGIDGKVYLAPNDNLTRAELAAVANRYN